MNLPMSQKKSLDGLFKRPQSLLEVSKRVKDGDPFTPVFREFLDSVNNTKNLLPMIEDEPEKLSPTQDAYLAAAAEYFANEARIRPPLWTESPSRFLHSPWFPCKLESLKPILLKESPSEFRRRLIFVELHPFVRRGQVISVPVHQDNLDLIPKVTSRIR